MATLAEIRQQYPQYKDMSDQRLADAMYNKFYSDMPREEFNKKIGYQPPEDRGMMTEAAVDMAESPLGRFGVNLVRGAAQLPGLPVEAGVLLGNLANKATGKPWRPVEDDPTLKKWGARGWLDSFERNFGKANLPAPQDDIERIADKAGQFVGGALPFGPAGVGPALAATAGSEVGRATDEVGVTGGYGEIGGALLGGAVPGLVRGQVTSGIANAPSLDAIRKAKDAAYAASEAEGAIFTPAFLARLKQNIESTFADASYLPENEPGLSGFLRALTEAQGKNHTLASIDKLRKAAGNAAGDFTKPSQQSLASRAKEVIDDALDPDSIQQGDVLAGNHAKAVELITNARQLNQRLRLGEKIEEARYQAKLQAGSSGVGGNVENAMRQKIKAILANPKRRAGFSKSEQKMMGDIVTGTPSGNFLRWAGGFSPAKGFLPTVAAGLVGGGVASGTAPLTVPLAAGIGALHGAKVLGESLTKRNIERLSAAVRIGRQGAQSAKDRANAVWKEMQRRSLLARQSAARAAPGAPTYQEP